MIAHMKVVGTAVAVDADASCRIGSAYCLLCSRYAVMNYLRKSSAVGTVEMAASRETVGSLRPYVR
jgi:hypothetical protein